MSKRIASNSSVMGAISMKVRFVEWWFKGRGSSAIEFEGISNSAERWEF